MLKLLVLTPILFFALTAFAVSFEEPPDRATATFAVS